MQGLPKRLIEVDLPIAAISAASRREKSLRHGHISTLHIWWARRPLASVRAALLGALWPDPGDPNCPPAFLAAAGRFMREFRDARGGRSRNWSDSAELRAALLEFIADFSNWDHANDRLFLTTARSLTLAAHEALGGEPGVRPLAVDPFAGGGAIPLEALRVGADSFASDLNSVPVLLNKVVLEYVPRFGRELIDRFREWGDAVQAEARESLAALYPRDPNGAVPIGYLWARVIKCEGPGCGVDLPLVRATQLSRKSPVAHLRIAAEGRQIMTELKPGQEAHSTATVSSGKATCPRCGYTTPAKRVKAQMTAVSGGANTARLFAVLVEHNGARQFRGPTERDLKAVALAQKMFSDLEKTRTGVFPTEAINPLRPYANTRGVSGITRFGMSRFIDMYAARQAVSVVAFQDAIQAVRSRYGLGEPIGDALETLLLLALNRLVMQNTSLSRWHTKRNTIEGLFSKQALQIVWDFVESNPIHSGMASWASGLQWIEKVMEANLVLDHTGQVERSSAEDCPLPSDSVDVVCTDPPYFAAIPYADLSDVFHVWLRRGLRGRDANYFRDELAEKARELVVTNSARGPIGEQKDEEFFASGMQRALARARDMAKPQGIACIVFADSSTKAWDAMLRAVLGAGWVVTASWPIDTEMQNRTRAQASASLQSSIFLICRPRERADGSVESDTVGDWRDVLSELPGRIHEWMPRLAREGVVGADAIFACLGPALEIFSRYSRVEKSNGDQVALAEFLEHVWAAVANEALSTIFEGADAAGLEADARLTAMWLWTVGAGRTTAAPTSEADSDDEEEADEEEEDDGPKKKATTVRGFVLDFDAARKIAQGLGAHLDALGRLVEVKGETARLLPVSERARHLFVGSEGRHQERPHAKGRRGAQTALFPEDEGGRGTSWSVDGRELAPAETTLDRVHQAMLLFADGRTDALKRLLVEDGVGLDARFWRVAQSLSALYPSGTDEKRMLDGLLARRKGFNL
jgi:putative DNA methylase